MRLINGLMAAILFSGCAHTPLYLPTFSSSKSQCDPVYSSHVPESVANNYINAKLLEKYADILKENPSYIDKFFPSPSTIDALGKNGAEIGLGAAAVISAVQGNSIGAVIGSAVTSGLRSITSLRSEDKTQDRQDVCLPRDAKSMVLITEDVKLFISKDTAVNFDWAEEIELAPKEKA